MTSDDKVPTSPTTKGAAIGKLLDAFEAAAKADDDGVQFWNARELGPLLGYSGYRNFSNVVAKAAQSCSQANEDPADHFVSVNKMVPLGSGAERAIDDVELTRFACYLIAQNGDPSKPEIAAAQMYFAVQTRRQEVAEMAALQLPPMLEDQRRVLARDKLAEHNKSLASAARGAGVVTSLDFATFKNEGYKGLYNGLDARGIQRRKRLTDKQAILDHMPSGELAANLFVATQTEDKLKRERVNEKAAAGKTHFDVGREVRGTIAKLGGTMPEDYPAVEDLKAARKRIKTEAKEAAKLAAPPKMKKPRKKPDAA